jgi:hypothetical protein
MTALRGLLCDLGLGFCIATAVILLLLFAGAEDQGFIYVDF